jgi:hypothetical protein
LITIGFKNDRFGHSLSYYTGQFPSERRKLHQLPYPEPRERYYLSFFFIKQLPLGSPIQSLFENSFEFAKIFDYEIAVQTGVNDTGVTKNNLIFKGSQSR